MTRVLLCAAFAYLLLRPVSTNEILFPLLALLGLVAGLATIFGRRAISVEGLRVIWVALFIGVYGASIGANNPGFVQHSLVWIGGPLIFGSWAFSADQRLLRSTMSIAAWASILVSGTIIFYVMAETNGWPVPTWLLDESGAGVNFGGETTEIRFHSLSTLAAAAPMWLVGAFVPADALLPRRMIRITAAVTCSFAVFLGGRNAIVLTLVAVPLVILLLRVAWNGFRKTRIRPIAATLFLAAALSLPFIMGDAATGAVLARTWSSISDYFSSSGTQVVRTEQAEMLLRGWGQSPLFGNGLGATIPGYARSVERPWNFELQYHLMAFQLGTIGILLLILLMISALRMLQRAWAARADFHSTLLVAVAGALGMMIANVTNPYLQAPGHMWSIWLPIMIANVAILSRRDRPFSRPTLEKRWDSRASRS